MCNFLILCFLVPYIQTKLARTIFLSVCAGLGVFADFDLIFFRWKKYNIEGLLAGKEKRQSLQQQESDES
jgi:hypothetical protein